MSKFPKLVSFIQSGKPIKLHLGCGKVYHEDWINIDNNSDNNITKLDLYWDLRQPLPFMENTADFIYNEAFFEHLTPEESRRALLDYMRVLKPNGVLRISQPDLDATLKIYANPNWRVDYRERIKKYGLEFIQTRAEWMNVAFRYWGHQWIYDWEELERRMKEVGITKYKQCELLKSDHPELRNLETRAEITLVVEITK